jgi:hypothetical protein
MKGVKHLKKITIILVFFVMINILVIEKGYASDYQVWEGYPENTYVTLLEYPYQVIRRIDDTGQIQMSASDAPLLVRNNWTIEATPGHALIRCIYNGTVWLQKTSDGTATLVNTVLETNHNIMTNTGALYMEKTTKDALPFGNLNKPSLSYYIIYQDAKLNYYCQSFENVPNFIVYENPQFDTDDYLNQEFEITWSGYGQSLTQKDNGGIWEHVGSSMPFGTFNDYGTKMKKLLFYNFYVNLPEQTLMPYEFDFENQDSNEVPSFSETNPIAYDKVRFEVNGQSYNDGYLIGDPDTMFSTDPEQNKLFSVKVYYPYDGLWIFDWYKDGQKLWTESRNLESVRSGGNTYPWILIDQNKLPFNGDGAYKLMVKHAIDATLTGSLDLNLYMDYNQPGYEGNVGAEVYITGVQEGKTYNSLILPVVIKNDITKDYKVLVNDQLYGVFDADEKRFEVKLDGLVVTGLNKIDVTDMNDFYKDSATWYFSESAYNYDQYDQASDVELFGLIKYKMGFGPLTNAYQRITSIDTSKKQAPVIKFNLRRMLDASTKNVASINNPFPDKDSTLIDFGILEDYTFAGFSLIEYFRMLIGAGFIWSTFMYIWHKITPKEVIK